MSKVSKVMAGGLVATLVMAGPLAVLAADATIGADIASSYVWRGITINKNAVIQPSLAVEHPSGFAVEVWSNFDLGDDDGTYEKREFSEIDFDVSYTHDVDMVSVTLGYIEYTFPGGFDVHEITDEVSHATAEREAYVGVGADILPGLSLDLTAYQNLAASDATYAVLGAEYGMDVMNGLRLALNGSIAYGAKGATAGGKSGMHDYRVGVSAAYEVMAGLDVGTFFDHVGSLDTDVLPSAFVREDFVGGVSAYYSF